jgi:predicted nucleic acid-binding protein
VIVVDSSVWTDFLNGRNAPHVRRLRAILGMDEVIVGDLMLCEVLQGLESEQAARDVEALLRRFDLLIGTWCIENRASLLHNDSDFHPMTRYLGLRQFIGRER